MPDQQGIREIDFQRRQSSASSLDPNLRRANGLVEDVEPEPRRFEFGGRFQNLVVNPVRAASIDQASSGGQRRNTLGVRQHLQ